MTDKPTIFFSHSSADRSQLTRLKELFVAKAGGSIDVFLSSDGESIPLGVNWVHSLQDALERAKLMLVFVSPNSLRSNWLYFESGFSYSKKIRVVPIGFMGVDLSALPPPLSLLQGFNVTSTARLNNIISMANETFAHTHSNIFTHEEFAEVCADTKSLTKQTFGRHGYLVKEISLTSHEGELNLSVPDALARAAEMLAAMGIEHKAEERNLTFHGVLIQGHFDGMRSPHSLDIDMEPLLADLSLPIIGAIMADIRKEGIVGLSARFDFAEVVDCMEESHKISGRLFNSGATLVSKDRFQFEDVVFRLSHLRYGAGTAFSRPGEAYVRMEFRGQAMSLEAIHRLIDLLFERGVFFLSPPQAG